MKSPGNILVVGGKSGPARLLVVENWNSVAEVGLDGKLIALHKLNLDEKAEFICNLRTLRRRATASDTLPPSPPPDSDSTCWMPTGSKCSPIPKTP